MVCDFLAAFSDPEKLAMWVKTSITEVMSSVADDGKNGRFFAYHTRTRQVEEMYYRTLYILFVAKDSALPHIFSGEPPNSFAEMWRAVNQEVLEGNGMLEIPQLTSDGKEFTAMDMLNNSAHASFAAMATSIGISRSPDLREGIIPRHLMHWRKLCVYLDYIENMFRAGKPRKVVLAGVRSLHKPASAWRAKEISSPPRLPSQSSLK
jgi:hypothetical protein